MGKNMGSLTAGRHTQSYVESPELRPRRENVLLHIDGAGSPRSRKLGSTNIRDGLPVGRLRQEAPEPQLWHSTWLSFNPGGGESLRRPRADAVGLPAVTGDSRRYSSWWSAVPRQDGRARHLVQRLSFTSRKTSMRSTIRLASGRVRGPRLANCIPAARAANDTRMMSGLRESADDMYGFSHTSVTIPGFEVFASCPFQLANHKRHLSRVNNHAVGTALNRRPPSGLSVKCVRSVAHAARRLGPSI